MADKIENPCEGCPWRMPETCKVCAKEPDRKLSDGSPEPLVTRYGIFYVTKLSMDQEVNMIEIKAVGLTILKDEEVALIMPGDMPVDCAVVFMSKDSLVELKEIIMEVSDD